MQSPDRTHHEMQPGRTRAKAETPACRKNRLGEHLPLLAPSRQQPGCPCIGQQALQATGLRRGDSSSKARQAVVAPPFVVVFGIWTLSQFLDQALFEEPTDRRI